MLALLQPLGAMTGLLAIWLFACDHTNEFAPWLLGAALLLLGVGVVME